MLKSTCPIKCIFSCPFGSFAYNEMSLIDKTHILNYLDDWQLKWLKENMYVIDFMDYIVVIAV